ncbi:NlpC/P60 family protein [Devosia enhydra]|uniref:NlpC/P60 family protein n=1 Tax=Devosia enhydra TaxID=665118 RepID=A0A1K2I160_9HYPH|nr:NlpC/P60 family protein [Devosia enhydra]SFZ85500.1 NlpC/P60 family protein [Devosia enhydra]
MSAAFDPRLTLMRDGLAARSLQGIVPAERYVETIAHQAIVPFAPLRRTPAADGEQLDQLLFGEDFAVLDIAEGWALGQAVRDGYVGYLEAAALGEPSRTATHTVRALRTYAYAAPSIKAPPTGLYSMNALVTDEGRDGRFVRTSGGWFIAEHLAPIDQPEPEPVAVAERFVGTPYLWGGRQSLGLDCSGLVQQAFYACGKTCPRDSDQQALLGSPVDVPTRGDLVFWRGHVAMMVNETHITHASGWHMQVVIEPLAEAIARTARSGGGDPTGFRRP